MTRAPFGDGRRSAAILSRLLVVLGLLLFGFPQGHADGMATNAGPAAQGKVEQAEGILSVQRHLRAQVPDDNPPDAAVPSAAAQAWSSRFVATMSPAPRQSLLPIANRILPPVRGPPAV